MSRVNKVDLMLGLVSCKCARHQNPRVWNFISDFKTALHMHRDDSVLSMMCEEHAQDYKNHWNNKFCCDCEESVPATHYIDDTDSWVCDKCYKEYFDKCYDE